MHKQLRFYLSLQRILHELKSTISLKSQQFRWLQTAAHIPIFLENTHPAASTGSYSQLLTFTHCYYCSRSFSFPVPLFLSLSLSLSDTSATFPPCQLSPMNAYNANGKCTWDGRKKQSYNERRAILACRYKTTLCVANIIIQVQCVQLFTRPFNISKLRIEISYFIAKCITICCTFSHRMFEFKT